MNADAIFSRPIGPKMSMSRVIRLDLLMIEIGWLNRETTSKTPRVIRNDVMVWTTSA